MSLSSSSQAGFLSLGALESFCSHQPYSPLFRDLSSDDIVTTLSGALMSTLYLAVALCETASLNTAFESLEFSAGLVTLNSQRTSDAGSNVSVAFLMQDSSQEEEKGYFRLWKTAVCEVMLTLCALQPSSSLAIQQSPIVSVCSDKRVGCTYMYMYMCIHTYAWLSVYTAKYQEVMYKMLIVCSYRDT